MPLNLEYDSSSQNSSALTELRELFRYRHLIFQLARRDILTRYKRSVLGVAWTMINPLGTMLVMTIVFSQLFIMDIPYYPIYILTGLVMWNFFSQATTAAMVNLVWGGGLLSRIYFPRTSFAVSAIITGLVNLLLSFVPLLAIFLITGAPIYCSILLFPLPLLIAAAFALGFGLLLSTFAVYFPDVAEMYQIVLTAWMYITPIIYPEKILPEQYRWLITRLNPMYHIVRLFRAIVYEGRVPYWVEVWPALLLSIVILIFGWWVFSKKSDQFAYRV